MSGTTCRPYSWNPKGAVVVSGQFFSDLAIDNQFNVYVVPENRAQILKWAPNAVVQPVIIDTKPSFLECIFYHPKRNALHFSESTEYSIRRVNLGETVAVPRSISTNWLMLCLSMMTTPCLYWIVLMHVCCSGRSMRIVRLWLPLRGGDRET